jgi:hypothetical protein
MSANAEQIRNIIEENHRNYDGELNLVEYVEMELEQMPEGFDNFFENSWDEISGDEQTKRVEFIKGIFNG